MTSVEDLAHSQKIFRNLARRAILIPILAMILISAVLILQVQNLDRLNRSLGKTDQIIETANSLEKSLADLQAGQRGFIIAGSSEFLETVPRFRGQIESHLTTLEQLLTGNREQLEVLQDVRKRFEEWWVVLDQHIGMKQQGHFNQGTVRLHQSQVLMTGLRQAVHQLIAEEEHHRAGLGAQASWQSRAFSFGGLLTSLGVGLIIAFFSRSQLQELYQNHQDVLNRIAKRNVELQAAQDRAQRLINANLVGVAFTDSFGNLLEANETFRKMLGLVQISDLKQINLRTLTPARWHEIDQKAEFELSSAGTVKPYEKEFTVQNGQTIPVLISIGILGANHHSEQVLFAMDLTEQKRTTLDLQRTHERLELALDNAQMATWEYNFDSGDFLRSENHDRLFGFKEPLPEFNIAHLLDLIFPEDQAGFRVRLQNVSASKSENEFFHEFRVVWPNQSVHWLSARGRVGRDLNGRPTLLRGAFIDIGHRKEIEAELQTAKTLAEEASRAKSTFLANMSHEIRTPLAAILGFSDLLRDEKLSGPERGQYLEIISRNGQQLSRIVDEILDLSKVEAGHLEIEALSFSPLQSINEVVSLFELKAQKKGLSLYFHADRNAPKEVISDSLRLKQILMNIIGNAIKFSHHGEVDVTLKSVPVASQAVPKIAISVRDTGIGVPYSQRERIFEPFTQGDPSMSRKFGGTGLGLVLSRRLARALGGDLVLASSEAGDGSTFIITIAADIRRTSANVLINESNSAASQSAGEANLQGIRVLVVEDTPDNQILIKRLLTMRGAEVELANNGKEGCEKALSNNFNIVIMDIQMPIMNGYDAIHYLRSKNYRRPIIALTAHALREDRESCFRVGCDEHLTKPINPSALNYAVLRLARLFPIPDSQKTALPAQH